jgi:uncharacterized protein YndB with AHSA1/START domain
MTDRIEKSAELNAPIDRVWRALTDHVEFGAWFGVKLEGPFVVGQTARGQITHPGYEHVVWQAKIVTIDPEQRLFAMRWHPYGVDPKVDYAKEPQTLIEFRLKPTATGAHISIVESGFDAVPAHRRDEAFRMNDKGWTQQIDNIRRHVES